MDELTKLKAQVQALIDRQEILDCLNRYTHGMDRQDREMVRSAYHPDALDVHGTFVGNVDEFLDWTFTYHAKQKLHQHYISNHTIEIDGDTAHSECYYHFIASYPDPDKLLFSAGGRYVDRFERRKGAWRIATRVCTAEWMTEGEMMMNIQTPVDSSKLLEKLTVSRNPEDVSYVRPLTARRKPSK